MAQRKVAELTDDQLLADWLRWIGRAYDEAIRQGWRHKMFRLMRCIYEQNRDLQNTGGFFIQWAADNYVAASAMAFRRALDGEHGTENLFHMLCEIRIAGNSRRRFRSGGLARWSATADRAFNELRIIRHRDTPDAIISTLPWLLKTSRRSKASTLCWIHVQTMIAHRAPARPDAEVPTFGDFHAAVDAVGQVFERYYGILTHSTLMTREPVEQYNLYEPFRTAWIIDAEKFDYERCEGGA